MLEISINMIAPIKDKISHKHCFRMHELQMLSCYKYVTVDNRYIRHIPFICSIP